MVNEGSGGRSSNVAGPSRRRNLIPEEDATKLQFGEFADGEALTPTDVQSILEAARNAPGVPPQPDNKVYKTAVEYVREFSNATPEVIESMRSALAVHPGFLNKFEVAQIIYLRPPNIEAAVGLIPSLDRYRGGEEEDTLLHLLTDVQSIARYGVKTEQ